GGGRPSRPQRARGHAGGLDQVLGQRAGLLLLPGPPGEHRGDAGDPRDHAARVSLGGGREERGLDDPVNALLAASPAPYETGSKRIEKAVRQALLSHGLLLLPAGRGVLGLTKTAPHPRRPVPPRRRHPRRWRLLGLPAPPATVRRRPGARRGGSGSPPPPAPPRRGTAAPQSGAVPRARRRRGPSPRPRRRSPGP